jgi:hypothetical protein
MNTQNSITYLPSSNIGEARQRALASGRAAQCACSVQTTRTPVRLPASGSAVLAACGGSVRRLEAVQRPSSGVRLGLYSMRRARSTGGVCRRRAAACTENRRGVAAAGGSAGVRRRTGVVSRRRARGGVEPALRDGGGRLCGGAFGCRG